MKVRVRLYGTLSQRFPGYRHSQGIEAEIPATWIGDSVDIILFGDVDGNGVINVIDMTKVARIILELDPPTPAADANRDKVINVLDMTQIARIILELD